MQKQIVMFWKWFKENEEDIFKKIEQLPNEIAGQITSKLHEINSDLAFEISFEQINQRRNFVISADGDYDLFDTVINIVKSSPTLNYWNVIPFRPRLHQKNQVIEIEEISLDYDDIFFTYVKDEEEPLIHMMVFIDGYQEGDNRYIHIYFLLLDSLIGEFDAVTKVGNTEILSSEEIKNQEVYGFRDLINIIDAISTNKMVN